MISSMFAVEWIRFVTAWIFFEKASFALMSATLPPRLLGFEYCAHGRTCRSFRFA